MKEIQKKLEQSESQKRELEKIEEAQKSELKKALEQIEGQKKDLEQRELAKKELQKKIAGEQACLELYLKVKKKHEQSETQMKEIQKKLEQSESQKRELEKIEEAQKNELKKALEQIEAQKKDFEQREMKLKQMQERVNIEQRKANENLLKEKKKNEELRKKITELEDRKNQVQNQDEEDLDDESEDEHEEMGEIREKLKEKEEKLANVEALNKTLIVKELKSNTELQEARREIIRGWESASRAFIGVKRMGELDSKPFQTACKRKYNTEEADDQAAALCSLWEDYIKDSSWHPFKTSKDSFGHCKFAGEIN